MNWENMVKGREGKLLKYMRVR